MGKYILMLGCTGFNQAMFWLCRFVFHRLYTLRTCIIGVAVNFVQFLRSNALPLWLHEDTSSLRLLSDDNSGRQMIINFSWGRVCISCLRCCRVILMQWSEARWNEVLFSLRVLEYVVLLPVSSFISCRWFVMYSVQVSTFVKCFLI